MNATKKVDKYATEDTVEDYAVREVKKVGGMSMPKPPVATRRGWVDRVFLLPHHMIRVEKGYLSNFPPVTVFVEFKRPVGGKFEPLQERTHKKLRAMGFDVRVWNTKALVDEYLKPWRT